MTREEIKDWYKEECGKEIPQGYNNTEQDCLDFISRESYVKGYKDAKFFLGNKDIIYPLKEFYEWLFGEDCDGRLHAIRDKFEELKLDKYINNK